MHRLPTRPSPRALRSAAIRTRTAVTSTSVPGQTRAISSSLEIVRSARSVNAPEARPFPVLEERAPRGDQPVRSEGEGCYFIHRAIAPNGSRNWYRPWRTFASPPVATLWGQPCEADLQTDAKTLFAQLCNRHRRDGAAVARRAAFVANSCANSPRRASGTDPKRPFGTPAQFEPPRPDLWYRTRRAGVADRILCKALVFPMPLFASTSGFNRSIGETLGAR